MANGQQIYLPSLVSKAFTPYFKKGFSRPRTGQQAFEMRERAHLW
jgi:hypothetical protein